MTYKKNYCQNEDQICTAYVHHHDICDKECANKDKDYMNCEDEHEKYGCCCDTTKLKKILSIFKKNQTPVFIFTQELLFDPFDLFLGYISDIKNDMVYISSDLNEPIKYIIPLCNISSVWADDSPKDDNNKIKKIMNMSTLKKDNCCCSRKIADTIKDYLKYFDRVAVKLKGGAILVYDEGNNILEYTRDYLNGSKLIISYIDPASIDLLYNDDLIVVSILLDNEDEYNDYFIIPTCAIDYIYDPTDTVDASGIVPKKTNLLTISYTDKNGNIKNITEITDLEKSKEE